MQCNHKAFSAEPQSYLMRWVVDPRNVDTILAYLILLIKGLLSVVFNLKNSLKINEFAEILVFHGYRLIIVLLLKTKFLKILG